jgi:AcrR family transcriptional regulator
MAQDTRGGPAQNLNDDTRALLPEGGEPLDGRRRGRPSSASALQVCEALLRAAEQCLEHKHYADITVREVAAAAGVNPAMVNYYFDGKEGLFVALVEFLFTDWSRRLRAIELHPTAQGLSPTRHFVEAVRTCFYQHRSVLWLVDHELREKDSVISAAFKLKLASQTTTAIRRFVQAMGERGLYRTDQNLRYLTYSISALAVYPIVFAPDLERSYDISMDELLGTDWAGFLERSLDRLLSPP